jgi:hypothetical protein
MADSLTQQTISKPGVYPSYVSNVQDQTINKRFGAVSSQPSVFSTAGDHVVYAPAAGKSARLKWVSIYSDPSNTAPCIVTLKWSGATGNIYNPPFPAGISAFQHAGVREGAVDETIIINLSASQTIYVAGIDAEDF